MAQMTPKQKAMGKLGMAFFEYLFINVLSEIDIDKLKLDNEITPFWKEALEKVKRKKARARKLKAVEFTVYYFFGVALAILTLIMLGIW